MASNDDLLFAEHCVKGGFVTEEQVRESLGVQDRMAEMGVHESLRNVLVKRGLLREADAALVARAAGLRSGREPIPGYTLQARIGAGAMGSVYRAHQRAMKRDVAIKILRRDLTDDPRQVERLQREAMLVGKLDHPYIVRGLDCGESDGLVWFVMEFVEGRTLRQRIKADGPLPVDEAVTLTRKLAEALVHAHSHGVVHRDIKPGNILLTADDEPRLTDYGLAKGETDDALTQLDATLGTPQYIAPEQARNPRDADIRSDIYGLGATLYTMLAGRPPYEADTLAATLTKVLYERPVPLSVAAPGTPREVTYVVERMMAKDRRHRYAAPEELVRDLKALEAGRLHVPTGFRGDIEQYVEARRRRRLWAVGATLVVVILAASLVTWSWTEREREQRRQDSARGDLSAVLSKAGARESWEGSTVATMIRALETHLDEHGDADTAARAREELARWRRQEDAIERVQELTRRASDERDQAWPRLLADLRAELSRLDRSDDVDVARRRLAELVTRVEETRSRRARLALQTALEGLEGLTLTEAAGHLRAAASSLRDRFYGPGPAPEAAEASELADDFARAQQRLDAHFAEYENAAAASELLDADLRALDGRLLSAVTAAADDAELSELLARLPPVGTRTRALFARQEREHARLVAASRRRWSEAQAVAEDGVERRELRETESWLDELSGRLLSPERENALELRDRIARQRESELKELAQATAEGARDLLESIGRRDYVHAREILTQLGAYVHGWAPKDGPALRLVEEGKHLLDVIESRAWAPLRQRLTSSRELENGLLMGARIRFKDVREVRLQGSELTFRHDNDLSWRGGLHEIDLEDLLYYSGLPGRDPEGALAAAALLVAETPAGIEPRSAIERMNGVTPLLERARSARDAGYVVERLDERRRQIVATAVNELAELESRAARIHDEARRAMAEGLYEDAGRQLERLLSLRGLQSTEYVRRYRDEIRDDLQRAGQGAEASRFARQLPGTRLVEQPEGRATLIVDFESENVDRAVDVAPGRNELAMRFGVPAEVPGIPGDVLPLVPNRMFAWLPWDGDPAHHPSRFPLEIDVPFLQRERVEVSFLYRSDAPFFLMVSCGGVNAGVLSAADVREGGRGVAIWQADSLQGADEHFSERHRSDYIERHPEVIRREGDMRFFGFEPGRVYRVRLVKDARKASLFVDGRRLLEEDLRAFSANRLRSKVAIVSYTSGEVDDLHVSGILDPGWLEDRR